MNGGRVIVLIGLAHDLPEDGGAAWTGSQLEDMGSRLLDHVQESDDLGEVALTLWAAREIRVISLGVTS